MEKQETEKVETVETFEEWLQREDYGDREQLKRCWEKAQEIARAEEQIQFSIFLKNVVDNFKGYEIYPTNQLRYIIKVSFSLFSSLIEKYDEKDKNGKVNSASHPEDL